MSKVLHLLGDVHGEEEYITPFINNAYVYSDRDFIQIGDWGVAGSGWGENDHPENHLIAAPNNLKVLAGNHDDYNTLEKFPHNLGRFGVHYVGDCKCFFVQGARSVDQARRREHITWWDTEELTYAEASDCLDLWKKECATVKLVITHEAPRIVGEMLLGDEVEPSITSSLLQEMWEYLNPPAWRFGHWHQKWQRHVGDTWFRCIDIGEVETLILDKTGITGVY